MTTPGIRSFIGRASAVGLSASLVVLLLMPIVALSLASSPAQLWEALHQPAVGQALALSVRTTLVSLGIVLVTGTPLAWWLARSPRALARVVEATVELPVVIPPAVIGIALLLMLGRDGLLGGLMGDGIAFTSTAVVIAQVVVAAPFYVQAAAAGFRRIDDDLLLVARTLGASPRRALLRVALPLALPSVLSGAALSWARALGEFGATLLFAGSFPGRTQTMPLAIYAALETDVQVATAIALVLVLVAFFTLLMVRSTRRWWAR